MPNGNQSPIMIAGQALLSSLKRLIRGMREVTGSRNFFPSDEFIEQIRERSTELQNLTAQLQGSIEAGNTERVRELLPQASEQLEQGFNLFFQLTDERKFGVPAEFKKMFATLTAALENIKEDNPKLPAAREQL